jgi:branched-chain amino acid aminotransferase
MSHSYVCINGQVVERAQLALGLNRAFKFGDGLFESIRLISGQPQLMSLHFGRLKQGMSFLKLQADDRFFERLNEEAEKLIRKNRIFKGGVLRLFVFRSGLGKYTPESNNAEYLIETEDHSQNKYELNTVGLRIDIAESVRISPSKITSIKSLNALPYVMASLENNEREFDDLILLNESMQLVEASSSNLFLIRKEELLTPPLSAGCLNGVMRKRLIEVAPNLGLKVVENALNASDLLQADEVFLTNSISGIRWVGAFRKKRYFYNWAKKLLNEL